MTGFIRKLVYKREKDKLFTPIRKSVFRHQF